MFLIDWELEKDKTVISLELRADKETGLEKTINLIEGESKICDEFSETLPELIEDAIYENDDNPSKLDVEELTELINGVGFTIKDGPHTRESLETSMEIDFDTNTVLSSTDSTQIESEEQQKLINRVEDRIAETIQNTLRQGNFEKLEEALEEKDWDKFKGCHPREIVQTEDVERYLLILNTALEIEEWSKEQRAEIVAAGIDLLIKRQETALVCEDKLNELMDEANHLISDLDESELAFSHKISKASFKAHQGKILLAKELIEKAIEEFKDHISPERIAYGYKNLGLFSARNEQWDDLEKYLVKASEKFRQAGENLLATECIANIGAELIGEKPHKAIGYYQRAKDSLLRKGELDAPEVSFLGHIEKEIGSEYIQLLNQPEKAIPLLNSALDHFEEIASDRDEYASTLRLLARIIHNGSSQQIFLRFFS